MITMVILVIVKKIIVKIQMLASIFKEKYKIKVTLDLFLYLFGKIQVFLDKTDIVNIYPAEPTRAFPRLLIFCCCFKRS